MTSPAYNVKCRLASKFDDFRKDDMFTDIVLLSENGERYPAHRIYLAKFSKYFRDLLQEGGCKEAEFKLPFNCEGMFSEILDALYVFNLNVTPKKAPAMLKICDYYGISFLKKFILDYIKSHAEQSTILYFVRKLVEFELIDEAILLTDEISKYAVNAIKKPGIPGEITLEEIFSSASNGKLFAEIIKRIAAEIPTYDDAQKFDLIERFVGDRTIKAEEKESLASVINWGNLDDPKNQSYKFLINNKGNWLPDDKAFKLFGRILDIRRENAHGFEKEAETKNVKDEYSRWYPFSWIAAEWNATPANSSPKVNVVEFIRTFGGLVNEVNPVKYGYMSVESKGEVIGDIFGPENILMGKEDSHLSYMTLGTDDISIEYKFNDIDKIKLSELVIDGKVERQSGRFWNEKGAIKVTVGDETKKMNFNNYQIKMELTPTINSFKISQDDNEMFLTLKEVKLYGQFE